MSLILFYADEKELNEINRKSLKLNILKILDPSFLPYRRVEILLSQSAITKSQRISWWNSLLFCRAVTYRGINRPTNSRQQRNTFLNRREQQQKNQASVFFTYQPNNRARLQASSMDSIDHKSKGFACFDGISSVTHSLGEGEKKRRRRRKKTDLIEIHISDRPASWLLRTTLVRPEAMQPHLLDKGIVPLIDRLGSSLHPLHSLCGVDGEKIWSIIAFAYERCVFLHERIGLLGAVHVLVE